MQHGGHITKDLLGPRGAPVGGGGGGIDVTTFTQALGDELILNGGMEAGDPPTSWTARNDATLSSVADERTGGAGSKSINIERNGSNFPGAYQTVTSTAEKWHEASLWTRQVELSGDFMLRRIPGSDNLISGGSISNTTTSWRQFSTVFLSPDATMTMLVSGGAGTTDGHSARADDASIKMLTSNEQQTASPDGDFQFEFTLPASPIAAQRAVLLYRIVDTLNMWMIYVRRNYTNTAYDLLLDKLSSGVPTIAPVLKVTDVGTPTLIRVVTNGNDHTCYTGTGTIDAPTWTQRGATQTDATHAAGTGLNTVYSSAITPVRLRSF